MAIPFYPATYQNPYIPQYQPQQQSGGLIWVQGEAGAKSHPVGAGQSVLLMDSESNRFFIKSADASGMPLPLRIFDYAERTAQNAHTAPTVANVDTSGFVTREEFEARIAQICAKYSDTEKECAEDGK